MSTYNPIWKLGNTTFYVLGVADDISINTDIRRFIGADKVFVGSPEIETRRLRIDAYCPETYVSLLGELSSHEVKKLVRGDGYTQFVAAGELSGSRRVDGRFDRATITLHTADIYRYKNETSVSVVVNDSEGTASLHVGGCFDTPIGFMVRAQNLSIHSYSYSASGQLDVPDGGVEYVGAENVSISVLTGEAFGWGSLFPPLNSTGEWEWSSVDVDDELDVADGRLLEAPLLLRKGLFNWWHFISGIKLTYRASVKNLERLRFRHKEVAAEASGLYFTHFGWHFWNESNWAYMTLWEDEVPRPVSPDAEGNIHIMLCNWGYSMGADAPVFERQMGIDSVRMAFNPHRALTVVHPFEREKPSAVWLEVNGSGNFSGFVSLSFYDAVIADGAYSIQGGAIKNVSIDGANWSGAHEVFLVTEGARGNGLVIEVKAGFFENASPTLTTYTREGAVVYDGDGNVVASDVSIVKSAGYLCTEGNVSMTNPLTGDFITMDKLSGAIHVGNDTAYYEFNPWAGDDLGTSVVESSNAGWTATAYTLGTGGGYVVFFLRSPLPFIEAPDYTLSGDSGVSVSISLDKENWYPVLSSYQLWNASLHLAGKHYCFVKLSGSGVAVWGFRVRSRVASGALGRITAAPSADNPIHIKRAAPSGNVSVRLTAMNAYL